MILDTDEGRRIADAIEAEAMANLYAAAPADLELRAESLAGATLLLAPRLPVSFFNRAIGLGVATPATDDVLDAVIGRFRAAGVAEYWLHLNPVAQPRDLAERLATRGFVPPARRSWAKFLRTPAAAAAHASHFLVRVAEPRDAAAVATTVCAAYGMPAAIAPWFAALVGRAGWHVLVAETDGKIAASGSVFIAGQTAWLGIGATLAEYRNRGAQTALLAARIDLAARVGCTLLATETGESVAGERNPSLDNIRKAGFAQVCSRLNFAAPKT
jgi:GNAT superfamily N-acetyltransferase